MSIQQIDASTPLKHYRKNQEVYNRIEKQLAGNQKKFKNADKATRRKMLRAAHRFAVLSIQTPVKLHEEAFKELEGMQTKKSDALQSVNYWKSKQKWINELDGKTEVLDAVAAELLADNIDKAHKLLIDKVKGVSTVKAAFMLAMLGFTSKMCLDTNLQQVASIDDPYEGIVVDKYEKQCDTVKKQFSSLSRDLSSFMLQWVLFDYQRGTVSRHQCFFKSIDRK